MTYCSSKRSIPEVEIYEAAADLPADWDELLPERHFLKRATLRVHEDTHLPDMKVLYAGVRKDGKWQLRMTLQLLSLKTRHLNEGSVKPWQRTLWRLFSHTVHPKLLVAGQLFRHDVASCYWPGQMPPFDAFRYFRQVIDKAAAVTCAQATLVKEVPAALVPYFLHHAPQYMMLRHDSSMQMRIPDSWTTFTDYEKALKHKYAQRLRKMRQSWNTLDVRELTATEVHQEAGRIYELYLQVTRRQPVRLGLLSEAFIPGLKSHYGDKLRVWGIYEDGKMIAFASAWVQDNSFDMFYIGFDYERNAALNLYFNILYFAIEQAILLRKPQLILGRTGLEAKARVGCRPEYLHTFLHIRNNVIRNIVNRMQQRFTENSDEWENRHPFKQEPV